MGLFRSIGRSFTEEVVLSGVGGAGRYDRPKWREDILAPGCIRSEGTHVWEPMSEEEWVIE